MEFFTYILQSDKTKRYYIGSTNNLDSRVKFHNKGNVKSTKPYVPWKLVHSEKFSTRSEAVKRENQLKLWKSRKALERLINNK